MRSILLAFGLSAACNQVFEIDSTAARPDAPPPPDTDRDGVIDQDDNCPDVENDQNDEDQDLIGDRCDNCPLVANPRQELLGDDDAVGTACDPHPESGGDCLVLFDSFSDPARFEQAWTIYAAAPPIVAPAGGSVRVTPADANRISLVARDDSGALLAGVFDTQLSATVPLTMNGMVLAASNIPPDSTFGYGCGVQWPSALDAGAATYDSSAAGGTTITSPALFGEPVTSRLLARLTAPTATAKPVRCRAEYGGAVGTSSIDSVTLRPEGAPGAIVMQDPVTLEAVAFYRVQAEPCATSYR